MTAVVHAFGPDGRYGPIPHSHDGEALTFGCPACTARVEQDQRIAAWATAPVRRCRWTFEDPDGERVHFTLDVRVPAGVSGVEVDEWYAGDTGGPLCKAIQAKHPKMTDDQVADLFCAALPRFVNCEVGAIVPPSDDGEHPSLFG